MYMLAQIAVTMAVDLDIEKLTVAAGGTPFAAEARRTFVGVYYLSSWYDIKKIRL